MLIVVAFMLWFDYFWLLKLKKSFRLFALINVSSGFRMF